MATEWDALARLDPLWAILSRPDRRGGGWSLDAFFATGDDEVESVLARREAQPDRFGVALDFGCGVGRLARALSTRFERCYGVDASDEMVEQARRLNAGRPNCVFEVNRSGDLGRFESASIDFVYSSFVLQHLRSDDEIAGFVAEFVRVVAPGGAVVFQLPEALSLRERVQLRRRAFAVLRRMGVPEPWLYRRARLHPIRLRGIDRQRVEALLRDAGATIERVEPVDPGSRVGGLRYYARRRATRLG